MLILGSSSSFLPLGPEVRADVCDGSGTVICNMGTFVETNLSRSFLPCHQQERCALPVRGISTDAFASKGLVSKFD